MAGPVASTRAQTWQMAVDNTGGTSAAYATASDSRGNIYLAGSFSGSVSFGSVTLNSSGSNDVYVAKWSPGSGFVWAQRAGGAGSEHANAIAVRGNEVYVTGVFASRAVEFGATGLANANPAGLTNDAFVAKINDAGTTSSFAWATGFGGTAMEFANAIAVSGNSVFVSGLFSSPTLGFGATALASAGSADAFVAKLTDRGASADVAWAQRAGGEGYDLAVGLAVSGNNVYMAGSYSGTTADFGSATLANTSATATADDVFVSKLTDEGTSGRFVWTQRAGGAGYDQVTKMTVSGNSLYVGGRFYSPTVNFGNVVLTNANTSGSEDGFLTKLTDEGATGRFNWTQQVEGLGRDYVRTVAVQGNSVYVAGDFQGTAALGATTLTSAGGSDGFVAKLTDNGNSAAFDWSRRFGGPGHDYGYGLALGGGRIFVAGGVAPLASIGSFELSGSTGASASFLASLTESTVLAAAAAQLSAEVELFPSPARGTATVRVPAVPGTPHASFVVYDALGRVVRTTSAPLPATGLRYSLNLGGLPAGLYTVQVRAGELNTSRRLVVE